MLLLVLAAYRLTQATVYCSRRQGHKCSTANAPIDGGWGRSLQGLEGGESPATVTASFNVNSLN
jgi:hypothetical protein